MRRARPAESWSGRLGFGLWPERLPWPAAQVSQAGLDQLATSQAKILYCYNKYIESAGICCHKKAVEIEFDPAKDAINQAKHGISLADAKVMDMEAAAVSPDYRFVYGEDRFRAWGFIDGTLHVMAFTKRGEAIRVISLRKANSKENRRYGKG